MSTKFKLTKRDGLTRRVVFQGPPTWPALSTKIHELFQIPIDKVGVSYIDSDMDEVTLSSEAELRDYYQAFPSGEVIKFVVQDLSRNEKALPDTPRSTGFRNTFGNIDTEGLPFDIEDDGWQMPLSGMFVPAARSDSPHAFIRVVESDATSSSTHDDDDSDGHSTTDFGHVTSTLDKGKGKAIDPSPAPSVVDDLMSLSSHDEPAHAHAHFEIKTATLPDSSHGTATPVAEPTQESPTEIKTAASEAASTEDPSDPPLPTIDPTPAPQPSLTDDVATLLTTLTNVVSAHPELSEGLRNIVQNATNGAYWNAHRAAMSQAAGEFIQTSSQDADDLRRRGEEEAGKRVADALGGMLRTFSQVLGSNTAPAESASADVDEPWRTSTPTTDQFNSTSFWYGAPGSMWAGPRGHGGRRGRWGPPAGGPHSAFRHHGPPAGGPHGPFHHGPPPGAFPPPPAAAQPPADAPAAEKTVVPPAPAEPVAHLVSTGNPKVGYPQLEMYSIPNRHNTYHGQPSRRHGQDTAPESASDRVVHRITRRLAAMGITDKAHPSLPAKIKEQLPEGNVSEDVENNIVSALVEELLFMSPKPTASGSGLRDAELPGAWA
ncbi:hypothetical protein C8R43DRAFT_881082 [Mycena crocata]|nr:hypothetical protein C8R43DRAFT_881082 [Mycena crocata]